MTSHSLSFLICHLGLMPPASRVYWEDETWQRLAHSRSCIYTVLLHHGQQPSFFVFVSLRQFSEDSLRAQGAQVCFRGLCEVKTISLVILSSCPVHSEGHVCGITTKGTRSLLRGTRLPSEKPGMRELWKTKSSVTLYPKLFLDIIFHKISIYVNM